MSSEGVNFFSDSSIQIGFAVQLATLIGFLAGFVMFLYRSITSRINKNIDNKLAPFAQSTSEIQKKLDDIRIDTIREIKTKEEIDRERFRNLHDGQEFMKEKLKEGAVSMDETKKKLDMHLLEAAQFIGRTDTKIATLEQSFSRFRKFITRHEEDSN